MYEKNVCKFVPFYNDYNSIHTINFVFETEKQDYKMLKIESVYKVHYVYSGKGKIHTEGAVHELTEGDVFFTFPATPFCIESCDDFSYMYISYLGSRGNMILDRLNIDTKNYIFHNCSKIFSFWKEGLETKESMTDLISESILLYTFSFIGEKNISNDRVSLQNNTFLLIKKYVDDNLSDPSLSLKKISNEINYNQKYISTVFKKHFKLGFSEYLNTIRIQYSCKMIQQGYKSIYDISRLCGYSDQHYFSKVFKKKMGVSPKMYIYSLSNMNID